MEKNIGNVDQSTLESYVHSQPPSPSSSVNNDIVHRPSKPPGFDLESYLPGCDVRMSGFSRLPDVNSQPPNLPFSRVNNNIISRPSKPPGFDLESSFSALDLSDPVDPRSKLMCPRHSFASSSPALCVNLFKSQPPLPFSRVNNNIISRPSKPPGFDLGSSFLASNFSDPGDPRRKLMCPRHSFAPSSSASQPKVDLFSSSSAMIANNINARSGHSVSINNGTYNRNSTPSGSGYTTLQPTTNNGTVHYTPSMLFPDTNLVHPAADQTNTATKLEKIICMLHRQGYKRQFTNQKGIQYMESLVMHLQGYEDLQVLLVLLGLRPIVLDLIKSQTFVDCCLLYFSPRAKEMLMAEMVRHLREMTTNFLGCETLKKCFPRHASPETRHRFALYIAHNAFDLALHSSGNYIVQYVIREEERLGAAQSIAEQLRGHFVRLSLDIRGSNVVEMLVRSDDNCIAQQVVGELIQSPAEDLLMILCDSCGNFVAQTAYEVSKSNVRLVQYYNALKGFVKQNVAILRSNQYGKILLRKFKSIDEGNFV